MFTEYTIVSKSNTVHNLFNGKQELIDLVNEMIKQGWQPLGGIAVQTMHFEGADSEIYHQAMVK